MEFKRTVQWVVMLAASALLIACTTEIDISKTMQRNGRLYEIGSDEPFTGIVTGKAQNSGYRRHSYTYKKAYQNGQLHGKSYFYFPNGKIESVEPYEKGILDGVVLRYYDNGQVRARIHFVDGYRGGAKGEMFWDRDGKRRKG